MVNDNQIIDALTDWGDHMDDRFTVVLNGLASINKFGSCNINNFHKDAIEIVKNVIIQCGKSYSTIEDSVATRIYLKEGRD